MPDEFQTSKPIYLQIADNMIKRVAKGELLPGDKLLSVREMAIHTGVNPNTIQRTYSEMERMGILETKRGQGTFVMDDASLTERLREQLQSDIVDQFVTSMSDLGYTRDDIMKRIALRLEGRKQS